MTGHIPLEQFPQSSARNSGRILDIDVLRGFALFGIVYAHSIFWYAGGPLLPQTYQLYHDPGSGIAIAIYMIFVISKFFSLFSFLFGLSFYIQIQSLSQRGENVALRFGWRLAILGAIGFIHHLFWRADILTIYVPLGFVLIFMRNISNKTLIILALLLVLNIPTKIAEIMSILVRNQLALIPTDPAGEALAYSYILEQGNWREMLIHNYHAMTDKYIYQINTGRLLITFGYFLLGMYAGRMGWFNNIEQHQWLFKRICKKTAWVLLACIVIAGIYGAALFLTKVDVPNTPFAGWFGGVLLEIFNACMTIIYITGISLLLLKPRWHKLLAPLGGIGKMALTTYLSQSLIGVFIFFPIGLHLFTLTSPGQNALLCIAIFSAQVLICRYWLAYFYYGPVEWLWRSGTRLRWQPMRKSRRTTA